MSTIEQINLIFKEALKQKDIARKNDSHLENYNKASVLGSQDLNLTFHGVLDRPYRKSWSKEKVVEHIKSLCGTHFEPSAVELFMKMLSKYEINAN